MSNLGEPVREFESWPLELPKPLRKASPVEEPGNPTISPEKRPERAPERQTEPVPA